MKSNQPIGKLLWSIGWIIIFVNLATFLITFFMEAAWDGLLLNSFIGSLPYVFLGLMLIWVGKGMQKESKSSNEESAVPSSILRAKNTKVFGWIVTILASAYTSVGYVAMGSDVYVTLILFVGIPFIGLGLIIIWAGMRMQKKS
ncbi:MAG: hypothetical protein PHX44_07990 [Sulfurimonas sp.]|uniref:hypothetical protein n=1 Tax=Sulfurimonas sp. TaxID=2022749 RepID=UPI0026304450|nr:hypothetical protein [Sulfurimonas sp.]MDD2652977.1 hypothetical protein [Sulfurimonas sp.]MDD3452423.1 hypothetical protein [Sulfurimonas sp.]